jgi:hypothetical protein
LNGEEAGSRKQEAGNRKQETGNRKQEAGSRKQETGSRKQGRNEAVENLEGPQAIAARPQSFPASCFLLPVPSFN